MPRKKVVGSEKLAGLFGVDARRVQQLAKSGVLPYEKDGNHYRFDFEVTIKAYILYLREKINGQEKPKEVGSAEIRKTQAEADLKRSKADIAELQLKELRGQMHRAEDVEAVFSDLVFAIRSGLIALPGRVAGEVMTANSAAEASEIIRLETSKILEELSNYRYDPDVYAKRVREREGWDAIDDSDEEDEDVDE